MAINTYIATKTDGTTVKRRSANTYVAASEVRGNVRFHQTDNAARERARRYGGTVLDVTVKGRKGTYNRIKCCRCGTTFTELRCTNCGY